jgi:cbb3-type cytochrome oxidase maturation protein
MRKDSGPQAEDWSSKEGEQAMALIIASALLVGLASLAVLLWALSSGQYDDLDGDAQRILMDDDPSGD